MSVMQRGHAEAGLLRKLGAARMVPIKSPDLSISSGISGAFITVVLSKL